MIYAFTGHRPQYLDGNFDYKSKLWTDMADWLSEQLQDASQAIAGGALGVDTLAAKVAVELNIPLILALPWEGCYDKYAKKHRDRLNWLMERAKDVVYVCDPPYAPWKYQLRNEFMVDNCDHLLAVWNGKSAGGTYNCIKYARKVEKPYTVWTPNENLIDQ